MLLGGNVWIKLPPFPTMVGASLLNLFLSETKIPSKQRAPLYPCRNGLLRAIRFGTVAFALTHSDSETLC